MACSDMAPFNKSSDVRTTVTWKINRIIASLQDFFGGLPIRRLCTDRVYFFISAVLGIMSLVACGNQGGTNIELPLSSERRAPTGADQPLLLSLLPVESAAVMYERFQPLKYYLEKTTGRSVVIRIAKDYETAIQEIGEGKVHMACLDPATYCEVRARYRGSIVPLAKPVGRDGARSRSVLVVKKGSPIERVADMRGKKIALGSRQSSFSYLMPLAMLQDVGVNIHDFTAVQYLQQEDRVALSVLIGEHDVGALSESVARRYTEDGLKIIKSSEAIPQFVLCAASSMPEEIMQAVIRGLVGPRERGQTLAFGDDIESFEPAADRDFDVVRVMQKNLTGRDYVEYRERTVKVAVLPLYSAITLYDRYDPLMRYLSAKTGYEFKLLIPKDFEDFVRVVRSGKADFSYQNPYIFAVIRRDQDIVPLVTTLGEDHLAEGEGGGENFRGVIITRKDSPIETLAGLKNRKVLITSPKSAGGYLSQKLFLAKYGIDADKDLKIVDAKKQENVILGVYRGEADAGFVRESALIVWKDEVDMEKIKVLARTTPLPNWPFALCSKRNPGLGEKVRSILIGIKDKTVLDAAKINGFKAANSAEFDALGGY
ncbi:MAG: phosphate/phosphite/phosphonate ABC transporter substrate-binding protein [Thermodesulfovibrionales bacterium]